MIIKNIENEMSINKLEIDSKTEESLQMVCCKFDYFYASCNKGSSHGIKSNGIKLMCNNRVCPCFFCSYSFGMKPQTGQYKITLKIDHIKVDNYANVVGIISQDSKHNNKIGTGEYWESELNDYIGWSACGVQNHSHLSNGLFCGNSEASRAKNIFRKNKFSYKSNNENYKERLPPIQTGDVVILSYDSNNGILSFGKENDNGKLNAHICNLPKMNTYYWFVGHVSGEMSVTVLN